MPRTIRPRRTAGALGALLLCCAVATATAQPGPAGTGVVRGAVVDTDDRAVAGARVILTPIDRPGAAVRAETDTDGRFSRSDVDAGLYAVTAAHGDLGSDVYRIRVRAERAVDIRFVVEPGRVAPWVAEDAAREELSRLFAAGVAANRNGAHQEAVRHFTQAAELNPSCLECFYNAGVAYAALERWADAERAFRTTLAVKDDYAAAYYGLSNVYAQWGRPDEASAARDAANRIALASMAANREQAAEMVDRGLAFLEAGRLDDARLRFDDTVTRYPTYAPAHYWLGVALDDLGEPGPAAAALRRYLSLDTAGEHAAAARARLAALEPRR